jgi:plasmid stabilization system protein ParE
MRFPEAAPLRQEFGEGVRMSVFRSYLVLYTVTSDVLEILRIVHGSRNLSDLI